MQSCPNVLSHKYFKLLSPASKSCYHGRRCCAAEMSPQRKPSRLSLTHWCAGVIPCHSRHTALRARNGRHVSLSAPTLSGCNFSPLEESHTCFTLHLQNRRNKALGAEILLKHAIGRPGDFIRQLNKDQYTFIQHLFVITALLNLLDSKLQKCYSKQRTEIPIVNQCYYFINLGS